MRELLSLLVFALTALLLSCDDPKADRFELVSIDAPSLQGALVPNDATQPLLIYLPPGYAASMRRYPVVYYLPGFTTDVTEYIDGTFDGLHADELFDQAISAKRVRPFVFVVVQGRNALGGSFYVDSPVTGNWEQWVIHDVVRYVDEHYRTLANSGARSIAGESMGGFGALHIAMRHADTFGSVYAISPGLFYEGGLEAQGMFSRPGYVRAHLLQQERMDAWPVDQRLDRYLGFIAELYRGDAFNYRRAFAYAYGAAFAPDPTADGPPWIDYPFSADRTRSDGEFAPDPARLARFEGGFGELAQKVAIHESKLRSLRAITIHSGRNDPLSYIPKGCERLSQLLHAAGIAHTLLWDERRHVDDMTGRWSEGLIPFLAQVLNEAQPEVEP